MTDNNARKQAARELQAREGISYTEALRRVSAPSRRHLIDTVGSDVNGQPVRINLEEFALGGSGTNCLITGPARLVDDLIDSVADQYVPA